MALGFMSKINFKGASQQTASVPSQISADQSQQGPTLSPQPSKDEFTISSNSQQSTPKKTSTESVPEAQVAGQTSQPEGSAKDAAEAPNPAQNKY